jgi:hypothetical protein
MTFLELAQRLAAESGTLPGVGQPASVIGQISRAANIVSWIRQSLEQVENERTDWLFMQEEFEGETAIDARRYTAAAWNLTSFSEWLNAQANTRAFSIFANSIGRVDERPLTFIEWQHFYETQLRGEPTRGYPTYFTVSPKGEFCLSPLPDAVYTVRGLYRLGPQALTANTDVPRMPARHHMVIVWHALVRLAIYDEAVVQEPRFRDQYRDTMDALIRDQTPKFSIGGPLA